MLLEMINYNAFLDEKILINSLVALIVMIRYLPQFVNDFRKDKRKILKTMDTKSKAGYIYCLYCIVFIGFIVNANSYKVSRVSVWLGLSVFSIGILIGLNGFLTLKNNNCYHEKLICFENNRLVTHGIFQYVRHPLRLGLAIELTGIVILSNSFLFVFPLLLLLQFQIRRTKDEEVLLRDIYGEVAVKYQLQVPKFNIIKGFYRKIRSEFTKRFEG